MDIGTFSREATGLARNPLGIIALFIILIYGFASLTLGFNASLQSEERLPLVWFLVAFPVVVLATFSWLVSRHPTKLYAPGDYQTDAAFVEATKAAVETRTRQLQEQTSQIKEIVREVLSTSNLPGKENPEAGDLADQVSEAIDRATTITVDARTFLNDESATFVFPVAAFESLNNLTDKVFFELSPRVKPYEYGYTWVLRNDASSEVIRNARMITRTPPGKPLPDYRSLSEVGIKPGATLRVVRLDAPT